MIKKRQSLIIKWSALRVNKDTLRDTIDGIWADPKTRNENSRLFRRNSEQKHIMRKLAIVMTQALCEAKVREVLCRFKEVFQN